jgi:hypothetical protein
MAGLKPAEVICEIMNEDGSMSRMPDLEVFAKKHNLKIVTIADLSNTGCPTVSRRRRSPPCPRSAGISASPMKTM